MLLGILAGLATCALWGLTFVAPRAVEPFTAWDLTVARYGIFGLACALLMIGRRFRPTGIAPRRLLTGLLLGGAGYTGYFICTAFAVQLAGTAIPPVIIGTMPVFLAVIGNARDRTAPWADLAVPLLLTGAGVAIVNVAALGRINAADMPSLQLGILASIAAAAGSVFLIPLSSLTEMDTLPVQDLYRFMGWALVMGLAGSWLATWCWVVASRRLPLALAAQLIVAETVFGLAYGFAFEGRWPLWWEVLGAGVQIAGVCCAVKVFSGRSGTLTPDVATSSPGCERHTKQRPA